MSFFKKLKEEWKELVGDDKKDDKKDEKKDQVLTQPNQAHTAEQQRDFSQHAAPPQQGQNYQNQQYYQSPPQTYGNPAPGSSLPPGWTQQWDPNNQRYYYIDSQTGRSQWDPPVPQQQQQQQHHNYGGPPPPPPQGYGGQAGPQSYGNPSQHYNQLQPQPYHGGAQSKEAEKKKSGKGTLLAAGVGGAAVGALGATALSGGDSSSDEDERHVAATATPYGTAPSTGYNNYYPSYSSAPPVSNAVPLEDNPNLSSSQRSSLEEARKNLQEAEADARDSDASSSDLEELREAREEYAEEVEEAHSDLED